MADKLINYITQMKGSARVLSEFRKLKAAGIGLKTANMDVTRTSKLVDGQMLKVSGTFDKTGKKIKKLHYEVTKQKTTMGQATSIVGQYQKALMRVLIVVPVWMAMRMAMQAVFGSIKAGLTAYKEFEQEMGRVATVTLATGATLKEFNDLKKAGIEYAQRSTASLKETATAMYQLATAGISAKDTVQGFNSVMDLAIGTMNTVEQTGKLMAGAYKLFGNELGYAGDTADKFKVIADTLAYSFKTQQVELQEISNAFGYVANAANAVDFDFQSLVGTIGFLNTGMLKGSKAGTSLMNALVRMGGKLGTLEKLTGRAFDPKKPIDFVEVMQSLHDKIGEGKVDWETYGQLMSTFGRRGARAILSILQRYDDWEKSINRSSAAMRGAAEDLRIQLENNVPKQLEKLGSKWEAAWVKMGQQVGKAVLPALKELNKHFETLDKIDVIKKITKEMVNFPKSWGAVKNMADFEHSLKSLDLETLKKVMVLLERTSEGTEWSGGGGVITFASQLEMISDNMKDAAKEGEDFNVFLEEAKIKANLMGNEGKVLVLILDDLAKSLNKAKEEENAFTEAGIMTREKFKELQDIKKASGVSTVTLLQEELNYLKQVQKITGQTQEIKALEHKKLIAQTKELEKQRSIIRDIVSSSLADAMKEGDLSGAFDSFKEGLKNAFYDAAAEGLTNQVMNLTGLDTILGQGLDTLRMERAFDDGAMKTEMAIVNGFTKGTQMLSGAGGVGGVRGTSTPVGGAAGFGAGGGTSKPADAGWLENWFGAGGNAWQMAGMALMATSLFGGGSKSSSGQRYSTAPGARTTAATTRSTVKAVVTNITVAPVFNLDGVSIESQNLVKEVEGKLTPLIKDITSRILEDESISSGNQ